jgi:hypothetical protein
MFVTCYFNSGRCSEFLVFSPIYGVMTPEICSYLCIFLIWNNSNIWVMTPDSIFYQVWSHDTSNLHFFKYIFFYNFLIWNNSNIWVMTPDSVFYQVYGVMTPDSVFYQVYGVMTPVICSSLCIFVYNFLIWNNSNIWVMTPDSIFYQVWSHDTSNLHFFKYIFFYNFLIWNNSNIWVMTPDSVFYQVYGVMTPDSVFYQVYGVMTPVICSSLCIFVYNFLIWNNSNISHDTRQRFHQIYGVMMPEIHSS